MGLLRKLRKNKGTEQKVEEITESKKQTLTEQLGLPFDLNAIEYISIIHQDLDESMYYLCVSNIETLKILTHTHTTSKDQIIARLEDLKSYFKSYGNYVNLGEGLPLINLNRINSVDLIYDSPTLNHLVLYLSTGQSFHTKPEITTSNKINKNEFIHFTFWSKRNERLHGK